MEIIIQPTPEAATAIAARLIARLLKEKPDAMLGLATGSTPLPLYRALVDMQLDWSRVRTFNLDEYLGLAPEHPQSYHHFMWENLFRHVNIRPENVHIPDGLAADVPAFCADYEARIRAVGGIDLQLLGIGRNGHIGFNEPGTPFDMTTHVVDLAEDTIQANSRFFDSIDQVPKQAVSMGIASIMKSKTILLLAFGEQKADAVAKMVNGPVREDLPASILQKHADVIVIADEAAASKL